MLRHKTNGCIGNRGGGNENIYTPKKPQSDIRSRLNGQRTLVPWTSGPKRPPGDTFEAIQAKPHPTTAYQRAAALLSFFLLCLLRLANRQDCQCAGVPESAVL